MKDWPERGREGYSKADRYLRAGPSSTLTNGFFVACFKRRRVPKGVESPGTETESNTKNEDIEIDCETKNNESNTENDTKNAEDGQRMEGDKEGDRKKKAKKRKKEKHEENEEEKKEEEETEMTEAKRKKKKRKKEDLER